MSVIVASSRPGIARRAALAIASLALVGGLSVASLLNPRIADAVGDGLKNGIHSVQTVAAMLAERSPGERPAGALANLKPKREAALHARALPKIRAPSPTAYETLAGPPATPPAAPPEAPLYNVVAGGPQAVVPPPAAVTTPGTPGGPPILSNIPTPGGGGGGGVFSPPVVTATPETPTTPLTPTPPPPSAVPEPATWGLMLLGFALIGRALRRSRRAGPTPALD